MENLKARLSVKGAKCDLQFSTKERAFFEAEAGFTDEEITVFRLRSRGFSVVRIARELEDMYGHYYSISTVEARIRSIKSKILHIL